MRRVPTDCWGLHFTGDLGEGCGKDVDGQAEIYTCESMYDPCHVGLYGCLCVR